jgi:phosphoserine phosphatase
MKPKSFPQTVLNAIDHALNEEFKVQPQPVAAFDADGTLWNTDLGEGFFQYEIREKLLKGLPTELPEDPWGHYRKWKGSGDPRPAYLWLAQIHKGLELAQVHAWANKHVKSISPLPIFPEQQHLIEYLQKRGVRIYVVTASIKWSVEPGAELLGIPKTQVLGVQTKVESGKITDEQNGFITYREGKSQQLLLETGGIAPFLCAGNTTGDLNLLESASRIKLAVRAAPVGHELYEVESKLNAIATQNQWLTHSFTS